MYIPIVSLLSHGLVHRLFHQSTVEQNQNDFIELTPFPYIDLSKFREMLGDWFVSSLTAKGLWYGQKSCELQFAHEEGGRI